MAKVPITFSRTDIGKVISDIIWDLCKKISDNTSVETSGSSLYEHGVGLYILDNPNITEDSTFSLHLSGDDSKYVNGVLSLTDGDIARNSTLTLVSNSVSSVDTSLISISGDVNDINSTLTLVSDNVSSIDTSLISISGDINSSLNLISIINISLSEINISLTDLTDEAFGRWVINPTSKTLTLYRASDDSAFVVFNLTEGSVNEVRPYVARTPV